jgi:hypothetical protein
MTFRVQKRGVKNNWTVDGIYRSLSSAVLHCERAEGMSESGEEEMAFLIAGQWSFANDKAPSRSRGPCL